MIRDDRKPGLVVSSTQILLGNSEADGVGNCDIGLVMLRLAAVLEY